VGAPRREKSDERSERVSGHHDEEHRTADEGGEAGEAAVRLTVTAADAELEHGEARGALEREGEEAGDDGEDEKVKHRRCPFKWLMCSTLRPLAQDVNNFLTPP
jgi:hypothetical protein